MTSEPSSANAAERILGALAGDGPRRRHPGGGEQRRGEELVDRALDRQSAVDGAHADGGQRVQRVDAEHDLLERPARDAAHDDDVARVERHLAPAHRHAAVDAADHPRHRSEAALVPARGQRALQPLGVPASARAHDRDAHQRTPGRTPYAGESAAVRTLLIDNYDSYTFNLFHLLGEVNGEEPLVVRNDELAWAELARLDFDNVVISPGPGGPSARATRACRSTCCAAPQTPVLGVCLGHQALAYVAGGTIEHAPEVMHGRRSRIEHDGTGVFAGLPQGFIAVRYHSLAVGTVPPDLRVTAWTADGVIMGLAHRVRPLFGVQFHPESVSTEQGRRLLENFRDLTPQRSRPRRAAQRPAQRRSAGAQVLHRNARLVRPRGGLHRALRRSIATPCGSTARAPGRASPASRSSARRTGRSARSSATTPARARSQSSARAGASCAPRACSTTAAASSPGCARTRRSCRSTSSAGSPATSASSSRRSAAPSAHTPHRCPTPGCCCATALSPSTTASAASTWSR